MSLECCLSVAYYIEAWSYGDMLYLLYLSICLYLNVFMSYLCNLFFHYHFHHSESCNLIDIDKLVFWACLSKVQPQGVAWLLLNFLQILAWLAYKCCLYKKAFIYMQNFHGLLFTLRRSLICFYIIYMTVPIIGLKLKWSAYFKEKYISGFHDNFSS